LLFSNTIQLNLELPKMLQKKPIEAERGLLRNLRHLHPYQTMMYMAMVGSGFLFTLILIFYSVQRIGMQEVTTNLQVPKTFFASTAVMLLSAVAMKLAHLYSQKDNLKKCTYMLLSVLVLAIAFSVFQVLGWIDFYGSAFKVPSKNMNTSYVYFLTGIHMFHVLLAIGFLIYVLVPFLKNSRNAVKELILVTNPYQKKKMNMLFVFWYYVDVVWLVLFFYFALTF
jgi:cytochrome c oxidase subunit 3